MTRPATNRLKMNPPLGRMPVLQFMPPAELSVDPAYQRSIDAEDSQALIRRIAQHWNWDLCQPLVVARRIDGSLFVIDGQHRLEGARLRGDIAQLPCVVMDHASVADEAASFVHLNQQRRPLSKMDLFRAAVASGDTQALAIAAALAEAGLTVAPHSNHTAWKPGMLSNIGGIEAAWRKHGAKIATEALQVLATAFAGEVLQYAGTIFPGIVAVCAAEMTGGADLPAARFAMMTARLGNAGQDQLRRAVMQRCADDPAISRAAAATAAIRATCQTQQPKVAPAKQTAPAVPLRAPADGRTWCDQCERRVTGGEANACRDQFCRSKEAA